MNFAQLFDTALARLEAGFRRSSDKPAETPEAALRALWHLAAGRELPPADAGQLPLPVLDGDARLRLFALIDKRVAGSPSGAAPHRALHRPYH